MYKLIIVLCVCLSVNVYAQVSAEKPRILYGVCTRDSLMATPFDEWFKPNYDAYHSNSLITPALRNRDYRDIRIQVFFGTWCGDSKREVPRFLKLMQEISFPEKNISLIATGGSDSLVKQSPQHEEAGKGIYRVPTFIIYKNGKEMNRINEFPVFSLEKDLLNIFDQQAYTPNYPAFAPVLQWVEDGSLVDGNVSIAGLTEQLRLLVSNEHVLNSLGYLLLKQDKKQEALRLFQINNNLYPGSANVISSLGEGYYETGDFKKAISSLEKSLELNKDPKAIPGILSILYKAREKI